MNTPTTFFALLPLCFETSVGLAKPSFRVVLSGPIVDRLPSDASVVFGNTTVSVGTSIATIRRKSLNLGVREFQGQACFVDFRCSNDERLFSIELSKDLFDRPRQITIKLEKPTPHIRPFTSPGEIRYVAGITKRMRYIDLPVLDTKRNDFARPRPPRIKGHSVKGYANRPASPNGP